MSGELSRDELSATLAARQELGQPYEPALVEALAERVEQVVQARVRAELDAQPQRHAQAQALLSMPAWARVTIAATSLGVAVPCSILAVIYAGVPGVIVTWAGVGIVNLAAALPRSWR